MSQNKPLSNDDLKKLLKESAEDRAKIDSSINKWDSDFFSNSKVSGLAGATGPQGPTPHNERSETNSNNQRDVHKHELGRPR